MIIEFTMIGTQLEHKFNANKNKTKNGIGNMMLLIGAIFS